MFSYNLYIVHFNIYIHIYASNVLFLRLIYLSILIFCSRFILHSVTTTDDIYVFK